MSGSALAQPGPGITVSRSISKSTVSPGDTFTVTLSLTTNHELVTVGLKEIVPSGWNVTEKASGSFTFSPSSIEWIWTNIMANVPSGTSSTVTYDVKVPDNAAAGTYSITGQGMGKNTPANGGTDVNGDTSGDSQLTVAVKPEDHAPVLAAIGAKSVNENSLLSFTISANDADSDAITYSATGLPTGATFNAATATFSWTPTYAQAGVYNVTFTAAANVKNDSEKVKITVNNVDRDPVLAAIGAKAVNVSKLLSFTISATDADGDAITYSATGLPTGATLDATTGKFSWTPSTAGTYDVTFIVTANSKTDSEKIKITVSEVVKPEDHAPVLTAIGAKSVNENSLLSFPISANDADGDAITYSATGLPTGATFNAATATFSWTPTYAQAGVYNVTFTAAANGMNDSEKVKITVNNVDRDPVLAAIGNKAVNVSDLLSFTISATDADGDAITYSATGLPTGATLDATTGKFIWTPGTAGTYDVTFIATANGKTDSEQIKITVSEVVKPEDHAPVLAAIGNKAVNVSNLLSFTISATDADGDAITYSATGLPTGATLNTTTGKFSWTPSTAGTYDVTFIATSNGKTDSEKITITVSEVVKPVDHAPVLAAIGDKSICVTELLEFIISASDADGDAITYSATGLPSGATFDSGTCKFCCAPGSVAPGIYDVTFTATANGKTDSETIKLTIYDEITVVQPPVLAPIGDKSINAKTLLCFTISATDPDDDVITYSAEGLPSGATLDATTGKFSWTPNCAGTYTVKFIATANSLTDSETITITVTKTNRPPVLSCIGSKTVQKGSLMSFTISAKDLDGDKVKYSATGLPKGANLDATTGKFTWKPSSIGTYTVKFIATANGQTDYETVKITVKSVNKPPVLACIGSKTVQKGSLMSFTISAKDPDGDKVKYSATGLPKGANLDANTGKFTWKPSSTGTYTVKFTATANGQSDSETVKITVKSVNKPPVLSSIGSKTVNEGKQLSFTISAKDPDGDKVKYSATGLPKGAKLDATTGKFTWTPGYSAAGTYKVKFIVTANGQTDYETVKITVKNVK